MRLYTYFRSSAAYRVRIALGLKNLTAEHIPIHLVQDGGQHHSSDYKAVNPAGLVPALQDGDATITQSLAIIEYLEEQYPESPSLLPGDALQRAQIRALAQIISSDLHPINNLRILKYLENTLHLDADQRKAWYLHWVDVGLTAFEKQLQVHNQPGDFCYGTTPTLADACLIPQMYNARRFGYNSDHLPRITKAVKAAEVLPAFIDAEPENQVDAG